MFFLTLTISGLPDLAQLHREYAEAYIAGGDFDEKLFLTGNPQVSVFRMLLLCQVSLHPYMQLQSASPSRAPAGTPLRSTVQTLDALKVWRLHRPLPPPPRP